MAVLIDVSERETYSAPAALRMTEARLLSDVSECSVAVGAIKDVQAPIRDKQVVEAVVVIVANTNC